MTFNLVANSSRKYTLHEMAFFERWWDEQDNHT